MKVEVICSENRINDLLGITPIGYTEALEKALTKINENAVVSSWKDSQISGQFCLGFTRKLVFLKLVFL
jgi:hypothetical protein